MRRFDRDKWLDPTFLGTEQLVSVSKHCLMIDSMWWNYWTANAETNWLEAEKGLWIDRDYGKFNGKKQSVIICANGPGLLDNIQQVKVFAGLGGFIIAVDSALKKLQAAGIKPHLTVTDDAQECVVDFFEGMDKNMAVSPALTTHPSVIARLKEAGSLILWHGVLNPFSPWWCLAYKRFGQRIATCRAGFVVTAIAIDIAYWMGFDNIILVGNDLCYWSHEDALTNANPEDVLSMKDIILEHIEAYKAEDAENEKKWEEDKSRGVDAPRPIPDLARIEQAEKDAVANEGIYTIRAFYHALSMLAFFPMQHKDCGWNYVGNGLSIPGWTRRVLKIITAPPNRFRRIEVPENDIRRTNLARSQGASRGNVGLLQR